MDRVQRYDDEKLYFNNLESKIKSAINNKKAFVIFPHIEYLHFPFADKNDPELLTYLNTQKKISSENVSERLPFFLALVPYDVLMKTFPQYFKKISLTESLAYAFEIFKDPKYLKKWKQSQSFKNDIDVLHKFYSARLRSLDIHLEKILKPRENDSYIYLVGCHGEPFLEHDEFLHGNGLNEGVANIPAFIHVPNMNERININWQVGMIAIAESIKKLVDLDLSKEEFIKILNESLHEKIILQYDCRGSKFAIRNDGKYKYVENFLDGTKAFYNLTKDPNMSKNIIDKTSPEKISFYRNKMYDIFLHELSKDAKNLPMPGYCPYQIKLNGDE